MKRHRNPSPLSYIGSTVRDDGDYDRYHGREGIIEGVRTDDAGLETWRTIDSVEYLVASEKLDEEMWFRSRYIRPP